jgi:outer membrane protein OmpA-like peptidoglycan-associated protein
LTKTALFAAIIAAASFSAQAHAGQKPIGVVFFTEWSAFPDRAAKQVISESKAVIDGNKHAIVTVTGYADASVSTKAGLSKLRAQIVMDMLVAQGVPAAQLRRADQGRTPDLGGHVESRRVVHSIDTP